MTTDRSRPGGSHGRPLDPRPGHARPERPRRGRAGRPLRAVRLPDRAAGGGLERAGRVDRRGGLATTPRSRRPISPGRAGPPSAPTGCPIDLATAIARRLGGDRRVRIDLDLRGHTDFERDVWHKALEIPRGEVRPYGWIAAEIGRPKAVRAVGTALGHNPVPLIVPCHRVVRTDGSIGQYSLGGPENKRTILEAEGLDLDVDGAAGIVRRPLHRLRHDQDLLPADLPARPPGDRSASPRVPLDGRGAGARLSGLPACAGRRRRSRRDSPPLTSSNRVDGVTTR